MRQQCPFSICSDESTWWHPWSNCTGRVQLIGSISRLPLWSTILLTILFRHICLCHYNVWRTLTKDVDSGEQLTPTFFWYCGPGWLLLAIVRFRLPYETICRTQFTQHRHCSHLNNSLKLFFFRVIIPIFFLPHLSWWTLLFIHFNLEHFENMFYITLTIRISVLSNLLWCSAFIFHISLP